MLSWTDWMTKLNSKRAKRNLDAKSGVMLEQQRLSKGAEWHCIGAKAIFKGCTEFATEANFRWKLDVRNDYATNPHKRFPLRASDFFFPHKIFRGILILILLQFIFFFIHPTIFTFSACLLVIISDVLQLDVLFLPNLYKRKVIRKPWERSGSMICISVSAF